MKQSIWNSGWGIGLPLAILLALASAASAQATGTSQRSRGGELSGTTPFRPDWARGGSNSNAKVPYRDPARIDFGPRQRCSPEQLRNDPNRLRDCR